MKQKTRRRMQNFGVIVLIALGVAWVIYQFADFTNSTYTDNAQVRQLIVPINSRVQGYVQEVRFDDFTPVKKGDTLVMIDDAEYVLRLAQARADLANATAGKQAMNSAINTTNNNVTVNAAAIAEAQAMLANAEKELNRYQKLYEQDAVTQQQYDAIATNYKALKAKCDMLSNQKKSTNLTGKEQTVRLGQNDAMIQLAESQVALAELNLGYCVITAPCDGYCSRKAIQAGQLVQPGQTLLSVVDTSDTWIMANYKEKQTSRMAIGDSVRITVDAIPGVKFTGYISEISPATGAQFSPIPTDNSNGNFVKVQQRIPIKIQFATDNNQESMARLRSGMNAECKVIK